SGNQQNGVDLLFDPALRRQGRFVKREGRQMRIVLITLAGLFALQGEREPLSAPANRPTPRAVIDQPAPTQATDAVQGGSAVAPSSSTAALLVQRPSAEQGVNQPAPTGRSVIVPAAPQRLALPAEEAAGSPTQLQGDDARAEQPAPTNELRP